MSRLSFAVFTAYFFAFLLDALTTHYLISRGFVELNPHINLDSPFWFYRDLIVIPLLYVYVTLLELAERSSRYYIKVFAKALKYSSIAIPAARLLPGIHNTLLLTGYCTPLPELFRKLFW